MIDYGMYSILIKTCAMGLEKVDLGKSIKDMKEKQFRFNDKWGINVCGEGGEFESLTLDCPIYKKRINM